MIRAGGSITIDGMITAPAYIEFNDNAPTTIDDYLPETTKVGYRTYSDGKSTVWIGSVGDSAPAYLLTVVSGTGAEPMRWVHKCPLRQIPRARKII